MSAPRRPKLPPLVRYQLDYEWGCGDGTYKQYTTHHVSQERRKWKYWKVCPKPYVLRRLSDGAIVWRNKAAEEAGL